MASPYESEKLLGEYLLFHYGRPDEVLPYAFGPAEALNFASRVVHDCVNASLVGPDSRGLDLGCAVGRSSFELARLCRTVIGIDFSQSFIRAAEQIRATGQHFYARVEEGQLTDECVALLPEGIDPARVSFEVGDACNLRDHLGPFDVALLINVLDRLPDPKKCLERLPGMLNPGGQLVIASPYTWLSEYTPTEHWLGGYERDGQPVRGFDALAETLAPDFELVRKAEVPFLIREHVRKYQWSVSLAGMWRRR